MTEELTFIPDKFGGHILFKGSPSKWYPESSLNAQNAEITRLKMWLEKIRDYGYSFPSGVAHNMAAQCSEALLGADPK